MSVAPDSAARAAALDPRRSFLVEAPAGSGKTTLLVQRYLSLVAAARSPESVLAITFTRKAAGEMLERVLEALTRAGAGAPPKHATDAATLALAAAVLEADRARGWRVLEQPARLRILTIDALNHWLAARLPVLSRAGAGLEVAPRPDELYRLAARRTLAALDERGELASQLAVVLEHLDNEVDRLERLLAEMLGERDRWLRHIAAGGAPNRETRRTLEAALAELVAADLAAAERRLPQAARAELGRLLAGAAARLVAAGLEAGAGSAAALAAAGTLPVAEPAALPAWQCAAALLVTGAGGLRARVDRRQGIGPEAKADKQAFLALLGELARVPGLERALALVTRLPPPAYDAAEWEVLVALHGVLLAAAAELAAAFAEAGAADFPAVQQAALAALGRPDEPSDLTLELDYRLQHILVDEFQDTSLAQVRLLELLTAGWQAGDGRTLFLVGDPMQSIYRFREADVGLFLRVKQHGLGALALEPLALSANFRSRPPIVAWVNAHFPRVLPALADTARGAVPYAPSIAVREPDAAAAVAVELLEEADLAAEAARVVALVRAERARDPGVQIAVLGRARAVLSACAAALRAAGIAYQGVDLVPLAARPAVRDLVALTRALAHPGDRTAWLACLRAPWCGVSLATLEALVGDDHEATVAERLAEPGRLAGLDEDERARLARAAAVLGPALAERGRRPLAALVEATWLALGGPATLDDEADLDNAASFLARLDALESGGDLDDPAALESELADLYAAPDAGADERLPLMTVHRAKGLEWPVVILTGLGRRTRGVDDRLLHWLEFARRDGGSGLVLAPRRARSRAEDALETWLRGIEGEREALEVGRLLYVAATRAMERLYVLGHVALDGAGEPARPARGTLLGALWPALEPGEIAAARRPAAAPAAAPARAAAPALERLALDFAVPAARAALVPLTEIARGAGPSELEFEWVTASARHVGTVVHAELERVAGLGGAALEATLAGRERAWRRALTELGVGDDELDGALGRVRRALEATLADPRGRWLLDPAHREAASELALSSLAGGRLLTARIDRTFIDASGTRWIIDYKTSRHEGTDREAFLDQERERYAPQLAGYARLLAALEPGRPIRLGLYFPLLGGWREWGAGE